jgi:hypothetical protein
VPRRKNFAGSFLKNDFSRVWQWFLSGTTYSHALQMQDCLLKFSRAAQIVSDLHSDFPTRARWAIVSRTDVESQRHFARNRPFEF